MAVDIQVEFVAKTTVHVRAEVRDDDAALTAIDSPSTIKCALTDPDGTVVGPTAMTEDDTGLYDYFYNTETTSVKGWWTAEVVVVDGTGDDAKTSVGRCSFKVKA